MTLRVLIPSLTETPMTAAPSALWRILDTTDSATAASVQDPKAAFVDGYNAGAAAKYEEFKEMLAALESARMEVCSLVSTLEEHYRRECAKTLARIIGAAAPAISEAAAEAAIAGIIKDVAGCSPPADLSLTASPEIYAAIVEARDGFAPAGLEADESLAPGALHVRWRDGGFDCDVGRSLFAIIEFLNAQTARPNEEQAR